MPKNDLSFPKSVCDALFDWSERAPERRAIHCGSVELSYGELSQAVQGLAQRLRNHGVVAGDAVVLVMGSTPEFVSSFYAVAHVRANAVPVSPKLDASAIARYLSDNDAALVLAAPQFARQCASACEASDTKASVVVVDDAELYRTPAPARPAVRSEPSDLEGCLTLYTSGSEGHRKRICRTQRNLVYEGENFVNSAGLGGDDTILCLAPLYHSYGMGNGLLAAVHAGATLVLPPPLGRNAGGDELPFEARCSEILRLIADQSARVVIAVSYQYDVLSRVPVGTDIDVSSLRLCFCSGGKLPPDVYERFSARFGHPIRQLYGSTETGSVAANLALAEPRSCDLRGERSSGPSALDPESVGKPLANVSVRVVDEHGERLPPGKTGAITVRSPVLPPGGYVGETAANVVFAGGEYRTGDLGHFDQHGQLHVTGRKQTFVETGGYKVDPKEVERVLAAHPLVRDVAVYGLAHQALGQAVTAFVVAPSGTGEEQLLAHCRDRLPSYKVPERLCFCAEIPRNELGKALKQPLLRVVAPNFVLGTGGHRSLNRIAWHRSADPEPRPGQVKLEVLAAGLNFLDVLMALGEIPDDAPSPAGDGHATGDGRRDRPRLGAECCGRVVAVGAGVEHVAVGDEVIAIAPGLFCGRVCISAEQVVRKPAGVPISVAAALPVAHATAHYALRHVAKLAAGERILIHAASGGVGLAAVQIARDVGAEIFATAGSAEKRAYLEGLGIQHIMSSRTLEFAQQIRRKTDGEGVDVVLNALGGDFIGESFGALREFGRFVELGKRDYYQNSPLGLRPFLRGLSFSLVDLRSMTFRRPGLVRSLLQEVAAFAERGIYTPHIDQVFPGERVVQAFRHMAEAKHVGKVVVSLEQLDRSVVMLDDAAATPREAQGWRESLAAAAAHARVDLVARRLKAELSDIARVPAERIDSSASFGSMALDSLSAIALRNRLEQLCGCTIPVTALWDHPSVSRLAGAVLRMMGLAEDHAIAAGSTGAGPSARASEADPAMPIAIVGIGCRFPGGASSPASYWSLLKGRVDAIGEVPRGRFNLPEVLGDRDEAERALLRTGGFLPDIAGFDSEFFSISPREAQHMDPQQRLLLEVTWEALEDAGMPAASLEGTRSGVFVGLSFYDYGVRSMYPLDTSRIDMHSGTGSALSIAAGRIAYLLGLRGPAVALDTACSSSLVAVHLACQSLRSRETELVLAGGVNLMAEPHGVLYLDRAQALAKDGRCKPFDAAADGIVRAEGAGVVALKPLDAALRDGDPVYAVIRGTAVNQDGRSNGLTAPSGEAQHAVVADALACAGMGPGEIDYVETHGTGTKLGDPIEAHALARALAEQRDPSAPLWIGSVKSNLGHLEAAAGVAGLIKTVLALKHATIPATLHFREPNPHIDWNALPLRVASEARSWPRSTGGATAPSRPRAAGVSAFGYSGTNAHVIVSEAPQAAPHAEAHPRDAAGPVLLPLSARSPGALAAKAQDMRAFVQAAAGFGLQDIAWTAASGRSHDRYRVAVVGDSVESIVGALDEPAESGGPGVAARTDAPAPLAFVLPGFGSQWRGMGAGLMAKEKVFRAAIEQCEQTLQTLGPDWSLCHLLSGDCPGDWLIRADTVQPALFAFAVGLGKLWESWGIKPDVYVGHSMGEIAAAHLAGCLSLPDALRLMVCRSQLLEQVRVEGAGAMLMTELSLDEAELRVAEYGSEVGVASQNGAQATVLSGTRTAIERLERELSAAEVFCRRVRGASGAGHSPRMDPLCDVLRERLANLEPRDGSGSLFSTVYGRQVAGAELDIDYWAKNLRQTVLFWPAIRSLHAEGVRTFVEISPHPVVGAAIERGLPADDATDAVTVVASARRNQDERTCMMEALARLYEAGADPNWCALFDAGARTVRIPTYPWQRQHHWLPARELTSGLETDADSTSVVDCVRDMGPLYNVAWSDAGGGGRTRRSDRPFLVVGKERELGDRVHRQLLDAGCDSLHTAVPSADGVRASISAYRDLIARASRGQDGRVEIVYLSDGKPFDGSQPAVALQQRISAVLSDVVAVVRAAGNQDGARLWIVTRAAHVIGPSNAAETPLCPIGAALWGMARTIARECPNVWGGLIDLCPQPREGEVDQLLRSIDADDGETLVAWRDGQRKVQRLTSRQNQEHENLQLDARRCYLVTGGRGGIGLHVARFLAQRGARHLVLAGRSAPSAQARAVTRQLEEQGVRVTMAQADVANYNEALALLHQIETQRTPLAGVFHAAGVGELNPLDDYDRAAQSRVLAPKVAGAWNLHRLTERMPLEHFVLFSSTSAIVGPVGLADYSAANAFVDALAALRCQRGLPGLAINWGPWDKVGMSAVADERIGPLAEYGMRTLSPTAALDAMESVLVAGSVAPDAGASSQVAIVACDWLRYAETMNGGKFLEHVVSHQREHLERGRSAMAAPGTAKPDRTHTPHELAQMAPDERLAHVQATLKKIVAKALRISIGRIRVDQTMAELGLDSIVVVEVLRACQRTFGLVIYPREFYEHPSLRALAAFVSRELVDQHGGPGTDSAPKSAVAPVATDPTRPVGAAAVNGAAAAAETGPSGECRAWAEQQLQCTIIDPQKIPLASEKPAVVFVLSTARSGSSLLRIMLEGHPQLFGPPELHLLPFETLAARREAVAQMRLEEGLQRAIMELHGMDAAQSRALVEAKVAARTPTQDVYEWLFKSAGGRILIDKSPSYVDSLETLQMADRLFGVRARYIHLVRHPYAMIDSFARMRMDRLFGAAGDNPHRFAEEIWLRGTTNARDFFRSLDPKQTLFVAYESMVRSPERAAKALCRFIGVAYDDAVVKPYEGRRMTDGVHPESIPLSDINFFKRNHIDASLADAWKTIQLPIQLQPETVRVARQLGYPVRENVTTEPLEALSGKRATDSSRMPSGVGPVSAPTRSRTDAAPRPAQTVSPREITLNVQGRELCVCTWGNPHVATRRSVCIHGMLDQATAWQPIAEQLASQGDYVVAMDLRGHGRSFHAPSYSVLDFLTDVDGVLRALDLDPRLNAETSAKAHGSVPPRSETPRRVIGHSMGASLAAMIATLRPDQIDEVVLLDPIIAVHSDDRIISKTRARLDYLARPRTPEPLASLDEAVRRLQLATPSLSEHFAGDLARRITMTTPDGGLQWRWDAQLEARGVADLPMSVDGFLALLGGLRQPVTWIRGDESPANRPRDLERLRAALRSSKEVVVPGGHNIHLDSPLAIAQVL